MSKHPTEKPTEPRVDKAFFVPPLLLLQPQCKNRVGDFCEKKQSQCNCRSSALNKEEYEEGFFNPDLPF